MLAVSSLDILDAAEVSTRLTVVTRRTSMTNFPAPFDET